METPRKATREVFEGPARLLDELPVVGWASFPRAEVEGLLPHAHPGAYEICYIAQGRVDWWVEAEVFELGRGDVFVTRPGERHGGVDAVMHPCELYWLHLDLPEGGVMAGLPPGEAVALRRRLESLPRHAFPGSPVVRQLCARIAAEHRDPAPFGALLARSLLHELLVTVLRDQEEHDCGLAAAPAPPSPGIRRALAWMEERLGQDYSVGDVARAAGMGVSRFHERFLREVGLTPAAFRTRRRIGRAKRLLREGRLSITQVALSVGFSSGQHFATAFKGLTGTTPGDYRRGRRGTGRLESGLEP